LGLGAILLIGIATGVVIGWLWSASRTRREFFEFKVQAEGNARVAETTSTELRGKLLDAKADLETRAKEISDLHQRLKTEGEERAASQAELKQTRTALEDLSVLRDQLGIESHLRVVAETNLRASQANLDEQKRLLDEAKAKLTDTFNALSAEALKSNNKAFLDLARGSFETIQAEAKGDLESRQKAIDAVVSPLRETLGRYEKQIQDMENARQKAYGGLDEQLRTLALANEQLQKETGSLVTALRAPQVRGRWGEMTLRRAAELSGMSEHCDFNEQETLESDAGRQQRPDMIVNLAGNRRIVVDAKVPLQAFLDAVSATTEDERKAEFAKHGQLVRNHMNQLASRSYWEQFPQAPEVVVLFLPGESFFSAAVEQDRTLIEDGMERRVVLATPITLIALLRAVAYGWRQEDLAKNAQEISDLGRQLHDRIRTFVSHFEGIGSALRRAVDTFNKARGSLESRVLPGARKFKELKATTGEEIVEVEPIDEVPESLPASESTDESD
jgi:DNA recombination protein RmuC